MKKNTLVVTMGRTWQIIPELLGFTNPNFNFYKNHPGKSKIENLRQTHQISPVNKVYVITTGGDQTETSVQSLLTWHKRFTINKGIDVQIFRLPEVNELDSINECIKMADHIYKVVLKASESSDILYLSLAGGRKTMSAEMQQAGNFFGCSAMLHVVDKKFKEDLRDEFYALDFTEPPPRKLIENIMPLVTFGKISPDAITAVHPIIKSSDYEVSPKKITSVSLYDELHKRQKESQNLLFNFTMNLTSDSPLTNFRALYALTPQIIEKLKTSGPTYDIVKLFPKTELHCHFGGIALPEEMIEIALENEEEIQKYLSEVKNFADFISNVQKYVDQNSIKNLKNLVPEVKKLRNIENIPEPYGVAGFLSCFRNNTPLLKTFIYGSSAPDLKNINITAYEKLGDLQGSGLLQSENSIRKACRILIEKCRKHNVTYIEVRCSPVNYSRGELTPEKVVKIMMAEFEAVKDVYFNIIFIASRHNKMSSVYKHIELAVELLKHHEKFKDFFSGFDLAGAESAGQPIQFREAFLPLMEKCIHLTIHAGETENVESIWEAIYHLNADRVGHGLKLIEHKELMRKFRERSISIEMCPSSNDQIVGFNGNYPLKNYLDFGLKVTINTDNPGISLTNFSKEYIVADELTGGKLNLWDTIQLIKNGFDAAFAKYEIKNQLIIKAEEKIMNIIGNKFNDR